MNLEAVPLQARWQIKLLLDFNYTDDLKFIYTEINL